jgi:hypothetical protein
MSEAVVCHSDFTYAEKPVALTFQGQRLEIAALLAEWRTPDEKCFRVRTSDGRAFELSYRASAAEWQVHQL